MYRVGDSYWEKKVNLKLVAENNAHTNRGRTQNRYFSNQNFNTSVFVTIF
jgi:hypothetical protein